VNFLYLFGGISYMDNLSGPTLKQRQLLMKTFKLLNDELKQKESKAPPFDSLDDLPALRKHTESIQQTCELLQAMNNVMLNNDRTLLDHLTASTKNEDELHAFIIEYLKNNPGRDQS
jgi:flagellar biosynthesis/type III secretory pathway chaperone